MSLNAILKNKILAKISQFALNRSDYGPAHKIMVLIASASSEGPDEPEPSLHACTKYGSRVEEGSE